MKRIVLVFILLLNWFCLSTALAQDPDSSQYQQIIREALEEFQAGRWEEARALFTKAHKVFPNARTLRGIGLVSFEGSDYVNAINYLQQALEDQRKPLTKKQRRKTEEILAKAKAFVGRLKVVVVPASARFSVDGIERRYGGDDLLVNPGKHELIAEAEGYLTRQMTTKVASGATVELEITLDPMSDAKEEEIAPAVPSSGNASATDEQEESPSLVPFIVMGAGGALLIGSGVTGVLSYSAERELADGCDSEHNCGEQYEDTLENGKNLQIASFILLGAGVATAVAGLVLWFVTDTEQESSTASNVSLNCDARGCLGSIRSVF